MYLLGIETGGVRLLRSLIWDRAISSGVLEYVFQTDGKLVRFEYRYINDYIQIAISARFTKLEGTGREVFLQLTFGSADLDGLSVIIL